MLDLIAPIRCIHCQATTRQALCAACTPMESPSTPQVAGLRQIVGWSTLDSAAGHTIRRIKATHDRQAAVRLSHQVAVDIRQQLELLHISAIVPAPSPLFRRIYRGFSLPAVFAAALGHQINVPVIHALKDSGGTPQRTLNRSRRHQNLHGRIRSIHGVTGRVLLVDDVCTTGATLHACARELLGEQSDTVFGAVICIARRRLVTPAKIL